MVPDIALSTAGTGIPGHLLRLGKWSQLHRIQHSLSVAASEVDTMADRLLSGHDNDLALRRPLTAGKPERL